MSKNCRFAVAVHTCALLAIEGSQPVTSEWIAGSVNTNPVVIRRIVSALARAGLVTTLRGANGGSQLAKPAGAITLLAIAKAVDEDEAPALHNQPPNPLCPVGRNIQTALVKVIDQAEAAREAVLAATLLADVVADIRVLG